MIVQTREQWLNDAALQMQQWVTVAGFTMPTNYRCTCGFPSRGGLGKKKRTIGQCWDQNCSKDSTFEISVSPTLDKVEDVLSTLLHEMIHAAAGLECQHRGQFRVIAKALGFLSPMTQTPPSPELLVRLNELAKTLPAYPHAKLEGRVSSGPPKQGTRMIKLECSCGYIVRTSQKWIDEGLPTCACGNEFQIVEGTEDAE